MVHNCAFIAPGRYLEDLGGLEQPQLPVLGASVIQVGYDSAAV